MQHVIHQQTPSTATMQAMVYEEYGLPRDVLTRREIPIPPVADEEVLVRVRATSVNALDWRLITGTPFLAKLSGGLRRPTRRIPGADISGVVQSVGRAVTGLAPGDEVFGEIHGGGFAEYVVVESSLLVPRPAGLGVEESATLGVAALTALQGLRDWGGLRDGQSVLINGASGGVGTFAVQIAKALGASRVTAVVSPRHFDVMERLGVDRVIDYTSEDFTRVAAPHDLVFDNAGMNSGPEVRRVVSENGTHVMVTGPMNRWLGPVRRMAWSAITSMGTNRSFVGGRTARVTRSDLLTLAEMVDSGQMRPVIDRRWTLDAAVEALEYQGEGHARGKSIVVVS